MDSKYLTTGYQFEGWPLPEIRDPVLGGPGHGSLEAGAAAYRQYAGILHEAAEGVRAALRAAQATHAGSAAAATQYHLNRLAIPGEVGGAQARLAAMALQDQASYHVRARNDMEALVETDVPAPLRWFVPEPSPEQRETVRRQAVDAVTRYQDNTNHNLAAGFQAFVATPQAQVGLDPGPATPAPDWGGSPAIGPADAAAVGAAGSAVGASSGPGSAPGAGHEFPPAGGGGLGPGAAGDATTRSGSSAGVAPQVAGTGIPVVPQVVPPGAPSAGLANRIGDPSGSSIPPAPGPLIPEQFGPTGLGWRDGAHPQLPGPRGEGPEGRDRAGSGLRRPEPAERLVRGGPGAVTGPAHGSGGSRAGAAAGHGAVPLVPGGAAGSAAQREHKRPAWLVEDDPEAIWLAGLPEHGPPVIGADDRM